MDTQLRSFHTVATHGGFTAAANVLNIGQPTISSQVKALEERYRVELFHRRGRRVELTETGRRLLELTQRIASLESEAVDLLNAVGGLRSGHLRVSAVGPYHVTEMLSAFRDRYPGVEFSVRISNSREALRQLMDYKADVAVLAHTEDDPRIHAIPYSRHPVIAFVNSDHPWAGRTSVSIHEFAEQHVILREVGSTTRLAFEAGLASAGARMGSFTEIGSREAIWLAVERGMGVGIVSEFELIPHPRLHPLPFRDAEIYTYAHVVCLAERRQGPLVRAFFGVVESLLAARRNVTETGRALMRQPPGKSGRREKGRKTSGLRARV